MSSYICISLKISMYVTSSRTMSRKTGPNVKVTIFVTVALS